MALYHWSYNNVSWVTNKHLENISGNLSWVVEIVYSVESQIRRHEPVFIFIVSVCVCVEWLVVHLFFRSWVPSDESCSCSRVFRSDLCCHSRAGWFFQAHTVQSAQNRPLQCRLGGPECKFCTLRHTLWFIIKDFFNWTKKLTRCEHHRREKIERICESWAS